MLNENFTLISLVVMYVVLIMVKYILGFKICLLCQVSQRATINRMIDVNHIAQWQIVY